MEPYLIVPDSTTSQLAWPVENNRRHLNAFLDGERQSCVPSPLPHWSQWICLRAIDKLEEIMQDRRLFFALLPSDANPPRHRVIIVGWTEQMSIMGCTEDGQSTEDGTALGSAGRVMVFPQ